MASISEPEVYCCYHCGHESRDNTFKYYDNRKLDQPRYQCKNCCKLFTLGFHGRLQGKTYTKKRNEDPPELKNLSRTCCYCSVEDNSLFKYYNNRSLSQPRFQCLSCKRQFQMRLLVTGEERRLVHTSSQRTRAPRRQKRSVPEPFPNAASNSSEMSLETGTGLFQEPSDEEAQYADFLEAELTEKENIEADLSWIANGDNGNDLPPPFGDDTAAFWRSLEADLLTEPENNVSAPNAVDAFSSTTTVDGEYMLPPTWSNEAGDMVSDQMAEVVSESTCYNSAEVMYGTSVVDNPAAFDWKNEAGDMVSDQMAEIVSESTCCNSAEVLYGTLVVDSPAAFDSSSWSQNDTSITGPSTMTYADTAAAVCHEIDMEMARRNYASSVSGSWNQSDSTVDASSMSYADTAAACCAQMDMEMEMARKNAMLAVASMQGIDSNCSSSSAISFADAFHDIPEPLLLQQALMEDEHCSEFHWNEDDEDFTEMSPRVY